MAFGFEKAIFSKRSDEMVLSPKRNRMCKGVHMRVKVRMLVEAPFTRFFELSGKSRQHKVH